MNRFNPGQVVATPGALAALEASGESLLDYLARHLSGDWGDVDAEDAQENELSLKHDLRIMSVYTLKTGTRIWIITEADRSSTFCCPKNIDQEEWDDENAQNLGNGRRRPSAPLVT